MSTTLAGAPHSDEGILTHIGANRFIAAFIINGKQYTVYATFRPKGKPQQLPPFLSGEANVLYGKLENLKDVHSYTGSIGVKDFQFEFNNDVRIKGKFSQEFVTAAAEIEGLGAWEQQ